MINIEINYQTKATQNFETLFRKIGNSVFRTLKLKNNLEVSVALVSSQKIRQLNKRYRGKNQATDVLSYPEVNEIIISYPRAASQAKQKRNSIINEMSWLFCHGLLHLMGYDHQKVNDEKNMRELELKILKDI